MSTPAEVDDGATVAALPGSTVALRFSVPARHPSWFLEDDETMPESQPHDLTLDLLKAILQHRVATSGEPVQIVRNLAVRWIREEPRVGVDPDLCLIEPPTPEGEDLYSLLTWKSGHPVPSLAIEVVSRSRPRKDYTTALHKYAALGVPEVWVFDPHLVGPQDHGGPFLLQLWVRSSGDLRRVHQGVGPVRSPRLGAWLVHQGKRLRLSDNPEGTQLWPTAEEAARQDADAARQDADAARQDADAARRDADAAGRRIADLEAKLRGE